uniref:Phospholipase A(2) n=1 Tax=Steinernema glaseri TaxID=37863 RepID=A0A1I7ZIG9_9BILA
MFVSSFFVISSRHLFLGLPIGLVIGSLHSMMIFDHFSSSPLAIFQACCAMDDLCWERIMRGNCGGPSLIYFASCGCKAAESWQGAWPNKGELHCSAFNTDFQLQMCQCDSMFIDCVDRQNFADSSCNLLDIFQPCALANNDIGERRLIPGDVPYLKTLVMRSSISTTHLVERSNLVCCLPTGSMTQYIESVINQQFIVNLENILDTEQCKVKLKLQ